MATRALELLLADLAPLLEADRLEPDEHDTCLIDFPDDGPQVYIEMSKDEKYVLLVSRLGEVPPGRYREDIFTEALKADGMPRPRHGTLAFSEEQGELVLFKRMEVDDLNVHELHDALQPFRDKAKEWADALETGIVPQLQSPGGRRGTGGINPFGIIP